MSSHRPSLASLARILSSTFLVVAAFLVLPAFAQPWPATACAADRGVGSLNCTANDIEIAGVVVNNGVTSCLAGQPVTLDITLNMHLNAENRHDIGIFLARDGRQPTIPAASGGSALCGVFGVPTTGIIPWLDLDGNACGDFERNGLPQGTTVPVPIGALQVTCLPGPTGHLVIPSVVTWHQNATVCPAPPVNVWLHPGAPSKCEAGILADIPVLVQGRISIIKATSPPASPGTFSFTATGAGASPTSFTLADGQTQVIATAPLGATASPYTITEAALAGFDPTAQIVCRNDEGELLTSFVSVNGASRQVTVQMSANATVGYTDVYCTYTNSTTPPPAGIIITKRTLGDITTSATFSVPPAMDGSGSFTLSPPINTHVASRTFTGLAAGTYTVTEAASPAGWMLSAINCTDPTSNTTVNLGARTATINLTAGETVECTFDNVSLANITVSVVSNGGTGTFGFGAPSLGAPLLQLVTPADGVKASQLYPGLPPGTYAVNGLGGSGWLFNNLTCVAEGTDVYWSYSGPNATIVLPHGEDIECTWVYSLPQVIPPSTVEQIPTLGEWAMIGLSGLLLLAGAATIRRRMPR